MPSMSRVAVAVSTPDRFEKCGQDLMTFLIFWARLRPASVGPQTAISFALEQARAGQPLDHSAG